MRSPGPVPGQSDGPGSGCRAALLRGSRTGRVSSGSAPAWLELHTRDAFEASIFYGEVLDWAGGGAGCCVASYAHDHGGLRHGHATIARISGGAADSAPDPSIRPRSHVHFPVPDLEAAIEAPTGLGGEAVAPGGTSKASRWIALTDPARCRNEVKPPVGRPSPTPAPGPAPQPGPPLAARRLTRAVATEGVSGAVSLPGRGSVLRGPLREVAVPDGRRPSVSTPSKPGREESAGLRHSARIRIPPWRE
ncbi:VOC family protein [Streptomyces aureus]|uniref:VOC family protein n=1 Tax=Streptomyces aureus TaxID=193461 RepID=UPI00131BC810|nr:VOC family protein [Streptomyces aureus]